MAAGDRTVKTAGIAFEQLITLREAADLLGIHWKTLEIQARRGEVPATKIGKRWRFRTSLLDQWLTSRFAPGDTSVMHTHEPPYLLVAATSMHLKMTAPDGKSFADEVRPGDFHLIDSKVTHTLTNEGTAEGQIVEMN